MTAASVTLVGAHGSPYSRKMRAVLRYRRIPFRWIIRGSKEDRDIPAVPVALIPVLVFLGEDGAPDRAMIDSTFQIRHLEELCSERSLVAPDPAMVFLDWLIEDYADEWLTKAMFHYRWAFAPDVAKAAELLPRWASIDASERSIQHLSRAFSERQIERLAVVGSNSTTAWLIEESYRRLLRSLGAQLCEQPFVMGRRPGAADFGLFGQLSQLALFDPTSASVALEESPRVVAWCNVMEDLSGLEVEAGDWTPREALPATFRGLLAEIGRFYVPFLLANAAALERGAAQVDCQIDGWKWVQKPFPYQGKCLRWLRAAHAALSAEDRVFVDSILADTGCDALFLRES
jgi:glutathione S-transferase